MLSIRLIYWHLMAFFVWLSFKFHLSAAPTGHVIVTLKDLYQIKVNRLQRPGGRVDVQFYSVFNLSATRGCVVNSTPHPLFHCDRPSTICIGGWLGHRAGLDGSVKSCPLWGSIPRLFIPQQVTIPTMLYQVLIKTQKSKYNFQTILTAVYCTSN